MRKRNSNGPAKKEAQNRENSKPYTGKKKRQRSKAKPTGSSTENSFNSQSRNGNVIQRNPFNDFSWYNRNPALTVAAASVPFPYRPGMTLPAIVGSDAAKVSAPKIPGGMILDWAPSIGVAANATDPVNIAAMEVFKKVREAFSGSIDADAPDFMMYLLSLDSIFSYIGALKRMFRLVATYSSENYYVPVAFFADLTHLPEQWYQEVAAEKMMLFQRVNELIGMVRKLKCPAVFDLFNRHYWMNDNVYADDNTPNSQFYAFNQTHYLRYNVPSGGAGQCEYVELNSKLTEYVTADLTAGVPSSFAVTNAFYKFGKYLIDSLSEHDDTYIISGYLGRAYERYPDFVVDELRWDEKFIPVYIPEVLAQIENCFTIAGNWVPSSITQDPTTNCVKSAQKVSSLVGVLDGNGTTTYPVATKISIRSDAPTVVDVTEATRLTAFVGEDKVITCGTEIPLKWTLTNTASNGTSIGWSADFQSIVVLKNASGASISDVNGTLWSAYKALYTLALKSMFDWSPRVVVSLTNLNAQMLGAWTNTIVADTWEGHNMTAIMPETLRNLHRICLYSEFNAFSVD